MKTRAKPSIVAAVKDEHLFGPYFDNDLTSWKRWLVFLRAVYGMPLTTKWSRRIFSECTGGRNPDKIPEGGYQTVLCLCGRRSGKSRLTGVIGAYSAALAGYESRLSSGEIGLIAVVAPRKKQGGNVGSYIRAIFDAPLLQKQIVRERQDTFQLKNGNRLELLASDYRSVRGFTLLAAVIDEVCFLGLESSSKVRTDTQLVQSLQPALITTRGKLIAISSPYAKVGWAFNTYDKHYGKDSDNVLVWKAASKYMNPTLPQSVIDQALQEDYASARSEYFAEWRDVGRRRNITVRVVGAELLELG